MAYYLMPYAFGLNDNGTPNPEAQARLDEALRIARSKNFATLFLGAGMPDYAKKKGTTSLSAAAWHYLRAKGWPANQKSIKEAGYNTVTETLAFYCFLQQRHNYVEVEVVTSWWHKPRVWAVCRIIFNRAIVVHATRNTLSFPNLCFCIAHEVIGLPVSAWGALRAAKKFRSHNA